MFFRDGGECLAAIPFLIKYEIMNKIDPEFTKKVVEWLKGEHTTNENVEQGATMLLQLNRNKGLYMRIMRNPLRNVEKVVYELEKHVNYRLQGYTIGDIIKMDHEITPEVQVAIDSVSEESQAEMLPIEQAPESEGGAALVVAKGKRPDHDSLPVEIQNIWPANAERWKKIKATFELLKTLNEPCDRFEHLKLLKETYYKYRDEMCRYDDYNKDAGTDEGSKEKHLTDVERNMVDNAQSYISRFLPELKSLAEKAKDPDFTEEEKAKLEDLRMRVGNRVQSLLKYGVAISEERLAEFKSVDIPTELEDNAQG